jgi:hypothetical protein
LKEIELVLEQYLPSSIETVGGETLRRRVKAKTAAAVDQAIKIDLPLTFQKAIEDDGRSSADYRVYGSIGQTNYYVAKIPWVEVVSVV